MILCWGVLSVQEYVISGLTVIICCSTSHFREVFLFSCKNYTDRYTDIEATHTQTIPTQSHSCGMQGKRLFYKGGGVFLYCKTYCYFYNNYICVCVHNPLQVSLRFLQGAMYLYTNLSNMKNLSEIVIISLLFLCVICGASLVVRGVYIAFAWISPILGMIAALLTAVIMLRR